MKITFDPVKRQTTFEERGLDFADAAIVFEGVTVELKDTRCDYGETQHHLLLPTGGQDGGGGLHPAWRGPSHL